MEEIKIKDDDWLKDIAREIYLAIEDTKDGINQYNILKGDYEIAIPKKVARRLFQNRIRLYSLLGRFVVKVGVVLED